MMKKMMTAFSHSFVGSKCSIRFLYFSQREEREASSRPRICCANLSSEDSSIVFDPWIYFFEPILTSAVWKVKPKQDRAAPRQNNSVVNK